MKNLSPVVFFAILLALGGCASVPDSIVMQPTTARPQLAAAPAPANGAIFQAAAHRPLFEDRRARLVGDVITIAIVEKTAAGKAANSNGSKSGSVSFGLSKLFGVPASTTRDSSFASNGALKFEDKGGVNSNNNFTGTITVTVVDVLPNGNLVVSGEKQIALDKSTEYIRFSGVVSPDNIVAGNVVPSTQVADARVEYRTNTNIDKTEVMGALARFFLSVMPL
ncbi:MAG TPA: flagellar basal body L-ring protein FlgH [Burkholderiaceae bacterium]|nr:flagellar basal body L-ring protein FlgH [Burkholderiaceae bacterium]